MDCCMLNLLEVSRWKCLINIGLDCRMNAGCILVSNIVVNLLPLALQVLLKVIINCWVHFWIQFSVQLGLGYSRFRLFRSINALVRILRWSVLILHKFSSISSSVLRNFDLWRNVVTSSPSSRDKHISWYNSLNSRRFLYVCFVLPLVIFNSVCLKIWYLIRG